MIGLKSVEQVSFITSDDPAIDKTAPGYDPDACWRDGDLKHLPIRPGCAPTIFRLRRLTRKQYLRVMGRTDAERLNEIVAFGLIGADNLHRAAPVQWTTDKTDVGERLSEATLDAIFAPELFGEIALRILSLSQLDPTIGQVS